MDFFNIKHLLFIIWSITIVSLKTYPSLFIRQAGKDTTIAFIISSLLFLLFAIFIFKIAQKKDNFNLYQLYTASLGKFVGTILFLGLILTVFLTLLECSAVEANAMHTNMLLETPSWFFLLFFIVPSIYTVKKDLVAITTVAIIGIMLIIFAGTNLSIWTAKYKHAKNLLPFFENGLTPGFFKVIIQTLGLYGSIIYAFPFVTKIKDKSKIMKAVILGCLFTIQMEIISISGAIATFGAERSADMNYAKLLQTQLVSYYRFIEFGELFVMLQMVGGWFLRYIISFYSLLQLLRYLQWETKYNIYIISALAYLGSYFLAKDILLLNKYLDIFTYICFVNFIVFPCLVFTILAFKKNKIEHGKASS